MTTVVVEVLAEDDADENRGCPPSPLPVQTRQRLVQIAAAAIVLNADCLLPWSLVREVLLMATSETAIALAESLEEALASELEARGQ
jgi:hypothetical protein